MATRRQNGRVGSSAMPPPSTRVRPGASTSKGLSSRRPSVAPSVEDSNQGSGITIPIAPRKKGESGEHNIRVVIRCRRRSEREVSDNSPIVVSSIGAKSTEINVETTPPTSTLGVVTPSQTRTYPFDIVFGPEADQSLVYQEVVAPMLDEVLQGYNCTLFAYGQTGTGKTYTMQGDLVPTALGNPSAQAGMIPRVLFKLFHHLEHSVADYSVKVSYIELYNEELRDLLTPEADSTELKIFDDAHKKGVFIQGLEEVGVSSAQEALAILTRGSERRQIAATKFNEHSSRSHAVFTLTVHTKETSASTGDDLLRIGKMNLVDLAGSENIGRSGARDGRAREAGMINQSLLTLGRVINALVDHASHVPYRESKLTRLLQDSLGGRTKTCIVATVSPARNNVEETLSTLDYALRAKSIANRPELNARMTRNALLKDYVAEIERLKADVLAARERNGIFLSEDRWDAIERERESAAQEREEAKRQVEVAESQLRNVREEFEQSLEVLTRRDRELGETKEKLKSREEELTVKEAVLKKTEGALEEEVIVRKAHQHSEEMLDGVAGELKNVTAASLSDLGGLFDKLDRKTTIFSSNSKAVYTHSKVINAEVTALSGALDTLLASSTQHAQKLKLEAEHLHKTEVGALQALAERMGEQLRTAQDAFAKANAREASADEASAAVHDAMQRALAQMSEGAQAWANGVRERWEGVWVDLETEASSAFEMAEKAVKSISASFESVLREAHTFAETERALALESRNATEEAVASELARLKAQNAGLVRALEQERQRSDRAQTDLVQRVAGLVSDFAADREQSMREVLGAVENANSEAAVQLANYQAAQTSRMEDAAKRGKTWAGSLEKTGVELKRSRDGSIKSISASSSTVRDGLVNMRQDVDACVSSYVDDTEARVQEFNASYTEANDRMMKAKRARVEVTNTLATEAQATYRHLQQSLSSSSRNLVAFVGKMSSANFELHTKTEAFYSAASSNVSNAREAVQMLVETGTREDVPTGTTPRKRQWDFNDHWERTKPREAVLREWRQRNGSSSSSLHRSSGLGESHHVEEYIPPPPENEEHLPQETPSEPEQTNSSSDGEETVAPDEESGPETTSEETKVKPVQTRSKAMIASGLPAPRASMLPPTLKRPLGSGLPKSSALADRLANVPATRRRLR